MKFYLTILFALFIESLYAQDISFKKINTNSGLSTNVVYDAKEGPDGLLWIATDNGLSQYDGQKVINYDSQTIPSLESNKIKDLFIDDKNRVWILTSDGFILMLNQTRMLDTIFEGSTDERALNFLPIGTEAVDFITQKAHYTIDNENVRVDQKFEFDQPVYNSLARELSIEDKGKYVIVSEETIVLYDGINGKIDFKKKIPRAEGAVLFDQEHLIVSTLNFNELFLVRLEDGKIIKNFAENIAREFPKLKTYYRKMIRLNDQQIAITSGFGGLFIFDQQSGEFQNYRHNIFQKSSFSSDNGFHISRGLYSKNVFTSTRTTGLNVFNLERHNAAHISTFFDAADDLFFEGYVHRVAQDKNGLFWLGTQQGLMTFDLEAQAARFIKLDLPEDEDKGITYVVTDSYDRVWVGVASMGVLVLNLKGKILHQFNWGSNSAFRIKSNNSYSMGEAPQNRMWVGTNRGLSIIDMTTMKVVQEDIRTATKIPNRVISHIKQQHSDMFIGTGGAGGYVVRDTACYLITDGLSSSAQIITGMRRTNNGYIGVGTNAGLYIYKEKLPGQFSLVDSVSFSSRVLSVECDENNHFWVTVDDRLYRYDLNSRESIEFDQHNGFVGGGFRIQGSYQNKEGTIFYGSNSGISYFNPGTITNQKAPLNIWCQSISFGDTTHYYTDNGAITIPYKHNTLTINYTNVDIWNDWEIDYQYTLLDDKKDWKDITTLPLIIQKLAPGKYYLKLRGKRGNESWVQGKNEIDFNISYPWWRSNLFYILMLIALSVVGYSLFRIIKNSRQRKKEAQKAEDDKFKAEIALRQNLQKLSEIEMKALRAQMNPHFMFNSLNSINNFILKNDQENASDYLTNFASLMRIILENSRYEWVSLEKELRAVRLYIEMEELRFENIFQYHENIDSDINLTTTMVPPMIIQPYIENAIWHGLLPKEEGVCNLTLEVNFEDGYLKVNIEDNGIGKDKSARNKSKFKVHKKSFGMHIISERLGMINRTYNLDANVHVVDKSTIADLGQGTLVHLSMKIKNGRDESNNNR